MNNKGFTLIELLIVIAVMGLLGTIITVNLTNTLNNTKDNNCTEFVNSIEEAACVYVELSDSKVNCSRTGCTFKLELLINEGLVEEKLDECTKKELDKNATITVSYNNGEKICTYNGVKKYER